MEKVIALLPMKANSERIKNKNIKPFGNKLLYQVICEKLVECKYIDRIIINTDSELIASDSIQYPKVEVFKRPDYLIGNFVEMNKIIRYDIEKSNGIHFIQTHSTNPLLSLESINKAIETYFSILNEFDSIFSVTRLQTRLYWENGQAINHDPNILLRTQDLPIIFEENSSFYIFSKQSFFKNNYKRIGIKPYLFELSKIEALDIDETHDFEIAESIYMRNI